MSLNAYEMFETDKSVEASGVELDYGEFQIKIARSGGSNQKYNKIIEALVKPHQRAVQTETISRETVDKLLIEAHAKAVVISWTGVKDREGNLIDFNVENCIKLFTDLPELFADVKEQAGKTGLFLKQINEEIAGN